MEEQNNNIKKSNNAGIIILIIILLLIIGGETYYFMTKENKPCINEVVNNESSYVPTVEEESNEEQVIEDNVSNDINLDDLIAFYTYDNNLFYGYIKDGYLYYYYYYNDYEDEEDSPTYHYSTDMEKLSKINGIKRIKIVNEGTGLDQRILLITTNGKTYNLNVGKNVEVEENKYLIKYNIEDIVSYNCEAPDCNGAEILLKDGTTKKIAGSIFDD
jgi:hypothetical protein